MSERDVKVIINEVFSLLDLDKTQREECVCEKERG